MVASEITSRSAEDVYLCVPQIALKGAYNYGLWSGYEDAVER